MHADDKTKRLYRRVTYRIVPLIFLCYLIAMIDRLNIGFAKLQFMSDLHLNATQFGFAASLLYLGYILFEIPSNLMMQKRGIGVTLLRIMVLWGIVTMLLAFADSAMHFYSLRFMLGLAEAGFLPGVLLYFTYWFPERMRGRMTSWFVCALPVSGIVGGPLAGWIMSSANGLDGLRGWQWLFLIEGLPAVLLGVIASLSLARTPAQAGWLSDEERAIIAQELQRGAPTHPVSPHGFAGALADKRVWGLAISYFMFYCVENALLIWTPTLLKSVGSLTIFQIGWVSGGISLVSVIGMLLVCASSDRLSERRWHVIGCGTLCGACFMLLPLAAHHIVLTVMILTITATAVFSFLALFWTIPSAYLRGTSAAGGLAFISSVGAIGGVVSPIYVGRMKDIARSYYASLGSLGLLLILGMGVLYLSLRQPAPAGSLSYTNPK
jgi:sugar phosphate permease